MCQKQDDFVSPFDRGCFWVLDVAPVPACRIAGFTSRTEAEAEIHADPINRSMITERACIYVMSVMTGSIPIGLLQWDCPILEPLQSN